MSDRWQEVLEKLKPYNETVVQGLTAEQPSAGLLVIHPASQMAKEWLEGRLYNTIAKAVATAYGQQLRLEFVVGEAVPAGPFHTPPAPPSRGEEPEAGQAPALFSPGLRVANADYIAAFFKRGGAGYSQLAHHTTFYWAMMLGPAFLLWKFLDSTDSRPFDAISPNFWTPPRRYSFEELARKLNHKHMRYIAGDALECQASRVTRLAGEPISAPGCCYSSNYARLRHKSVAGGIMCLHWSPGLLERLHQFGLVRVEAKSGYKPEIQAWRMPPLLTPMQYGMLNETLQGDYDEWLDQFIHLFGLERGEWQTIIEPNLVSLMPGWEMAAVRDNFEERDRWQVFYTHSFANPNFQPCMAENSEESADEQENSAMHG